MYELLILVNVSSGLENVVGGVEKTLKEAESTNISISKLGKKVLAYPIAKQNEAEYVLFNFDAPGEAIKSVSARFKVEGDDILRYMLVKAEKKKAVVAKSKKEEEKIEKPKPKVTVKTVTKTKDVKPVKKTSSTKRTVKAEVKPKTSKKAAAKGKK